LTMSDSRAATGLDRLPWLADEPSPKTPRAKRRGWDLTPWAVAVMLLVAGAAFWLGTRSEAPQQLPRTAQPSATVPLPEPRVPSQEVPIVPQPQVSPAPLREVRPAPAPEIHFAPRPRAIRLTKAEAAEARRLAAERSQPPAKAEPSPAPAAVSGAPPVTRSAPLRPWQPRVVAGAAGRLVEIGAFGSVPQAKLGWRHMVRAYPAVAHLPAVVRPDRNSKGRVFYRFRIGTTSQAHSEVLCQRMERISFSCAVVGLPWKAKVER
jgi:hypothetical protein